MNRKWMAWVLLPAFALTLGGCPKKKPTTPVNAVEVDTQTVVEPTQPVTEVVQPDTAPPVDMTESALPDDVVQLNEYLRSRGLVGDVYFDLDESGLRDEARQRLAQNAEWLRNNPGYTFTIEGHCDERGTNEYNLALGERRATTAEDYISSLGVGRNLMRSISYGEERPVCTESSESCWQRNRRAHFVVSK